jgi:hypothetical protein
MFAVFQAKKGLSKDKLLLICGGAGGTHPNLLLL